MGTEQLGTHEYAGFKYAVSRVTGDKGDKHIFLQALPGQHPAASKEKHLQAALKTYLEKNSP
jgi:hypothetical protein